MYEGQMLGIGAELDIWYDLKGCCDTGAVGTAVEGAPLGGIAV